MRIDEIPHALIRSGGEPEAFFQSTVGSVGGDHKILLGGGAGHLPVGTLPLVEGAHVGDHEADSLQRFLNGVPHGVAGVVEDDGDPAARLENTVILSKASPHQFLIVGKRLVLELIYDGFRLCIGGHAVPGFHKEIQVGVIDVLPERRIGEDIVDACVWQWQARGGSSGDCRHVLGSVGLKTP